MVCSNKRIDDCKEKKRPKREAYSNSIQNQNLLYSEKKQLEKQLCRMRILTKKKKKRIWMRH